MLGPGSTFLAYLAFVWPPSRKVMTSVFHLAAVPFPGVHKKTEIIKTPFFFM
jgi:hypothetical protein